MISILIFLGLVITADQQTRSYNAGFETFSECIAGSQTIHEALKYCKNKNTDREPIFKKCLFDETDFNADGNETEEFFIDLVEYCMDIQDEVTPGVYDGK